VSPTSTILTQPSPKWVPHVGATQRGDGRKEVPFWWRGTVGGAQTNAIFFSIGIHTVCECWRACTERSETMWKNDIAVYRFHSVN
jgi:hypothetical protein